VTENLRKLVEALRTGELTSPAGTLARIEGVVLALESVDRGAEGQPKTCFGGLAQVAACH